MWEKAWKKVSSLRPERTLLPLRRIMKRLDSTLLRLEKAKEMSTEITLDNYQHNCLSWISKYIIGSLFIDNPCVLVYVR